MRVNEKEKFQRIFLIFNHRNSMIINNKHLIDKLCAVHLYLKFSK